MSGVDGDLISSLYPPPPVYFKFFTEENLSKLDEWKEKSDDTNDTTKTPEKEADIEENQKEVEENETEKEEKEEAEVEQNEKGEVEEDKKKEDVLPPGELKFLVPPKAPEGTHYRGYGNVWAFEDKLPSLKSANWEQLYEDDDESITSETKIKELHKLIDSLLLNFLELVGIASVDPQQFEQKIKDISLILININHLLNTYRPHQSRESLIMLLRKQIEAKRAEITKIEEVSKDVKDKIVSLTNTIEEEGLEEEEQVNPEESIEAIKSGIVDKLIENL